MSIELKIKSKHLAEEAKIIRFEERRQKARNKQLYFSLRSHRRWDVRNENRATFLARAYLAGKAYSVVEQKTTRGTYIIEAIIAPRVLAMVNKYGETTVTKADILNWIAA